MSHPFEEQLCPEASARALPTSGPSYPQACKWPWRAIAVATYIEPVVSRDWSHAGAAMFQADTDPGSTIAVALDAIRHEAAGWGMRSDDLRRVRQMVDGMRMSRLESGLFMMLLDEYLELINVVSGRCGEGMVRSTEISDALRRVAEVYDDEERRNLHSLMNLY